MWNGTLVRSRFFDAISLLLPAAERFLIETLEEWLSRAGDSVDSRLGAEVERFLREERAHQSVHLRYNDSLIAADPAAQEPALRASRATDDIRRLDLATRMALAAAFEILTSLLSRELLERPYLLGSGESVEARIWRWHAREELAHCHVVVQAVRALGVSRGQRLMAYALATGFLIFDVLRLWRALCRCDIRAGARRARMWADGLTFVLRGVPSLLRMSAGWTRQLVR
ncbi:MAG TPA: metal-dependent hydrolase [Albitalea sp.]|uniref:metal-dependent hydrolase n=1 Tax=Piscinibacter sp. TaxID=1903157 RepID=UPI002ED58B38